VTAELLRYTAREGEIVMFDYCSPAEVFTAKRKVHGSGSATASWEIINGSAVPACDESPRGITVAIGTGNVHIRILTSRMIRNAACRFSSVTTMKKMQREGVFREMKLRKHYEKPSEKRVREKSEAVRRARKLARKKLQREGLLPARVIRGSTGRGGPARAPRF
jgi:small subunit ribosomal protein S21